MRKPQGTIIVTPYDGSKTTEHDTVTCGHCEYVAVVPPGCVPAPSICKGCMRYLCKKCYARRTLGGNCIPFEKKVELYEKQPWRYILR